MADFLQADQARKVLTRLPAKLPQRLFGYIKLKALYERARARETSEWLHKIHGDPVKGKSKREVRKEIFQGEDEESAKRMGIKATELEMNVEIDDFARHAMEMFYIDGLSDTEFVTTSQVPKDEYMVTRWEVTGLHTGMLLGIPPTRKSVTITGMTLMKFAEERQPDDALNMWATDEWTFWDLPGLMEQLGVSL
jgi:hypothetical protein